MTREELKVKLQKLLDSKGNITSFYTRDSYLQQKELLLSLLEYSHKDLCNRDKIWEILLDANPECVACGKLCKLSSQNSTKQFYKTCSPVCQGVIKRGAKLNISWKKKDFTNSMTAVTGSLF